MPRGCGSVSGSLRGSVSQTYMVNLGTTTQTVSTSAIGARDGSLPTRNRSIIADDSPLTRKLPTKAASFQVPKGDFAPGLPQRATDTEASSTMKGRFRRQKSAMNFRAAESGIGDLLPTTNTRMPVSPGILNRGRTLSSGAMWSQRKPSPSLRSRRRSTVQVEDMDTSGHRPTRHVSHTWSDLTDPRASKTTKYLRRDISLTELFLSLKPMFILQVAVVIAVSFLVWDSHRKALLTSQKLHQFRHDESLLMLHLQRLEQQSIHLHENLGRINDATAAGFTNNSSDHKAAASVDSGLIRKQMQQLYQMEEELEHEVRSLRTKIRQSARNSIIHKYGEGPVQVVLEVGTDEEDGKGESSEYSNREEKTASGTISILLWHDTPHAAWTWLEQIENGLWTDVPLGLNKGLSVDAAVAASDDEPRLQFVENAQKAHEAWTVGLSDLMDGGLGIFINLRDNSDYHKHEACVGKVLDGFDVLQRIVETTRRHGEAPSIKIKSATASHLTRRETAGLV